MKPSHFSFLKVNPRKGERGLAKAKVTVWIYEGSLKVEHQAVTLSEYEVKLQEDRKHLQTVNNARQHSTPFRSPQLTLFDLGSDGWVLYWKTPDHAPARLKQRVEGILQLSLFELEPMAQAVGADERAGQTPMRSHLQLISEQESGPSL